jgi:radical SAM superfamily enzyme YgiQ (UPF0313 family)
MKICLVRPATVTTVMAVGEDAAPPVGLAYVAGSLRQAGHSVCVVDGLGEGLKEYHPVAELPTGLRHGITDEAIISRIPADTEVIGVAAMFSLEWPFTRQLIVSIRKAFPAAFIMAGGEHITALPEYSLDDCPALDVCVLGEGDVTAVNLLAALQSGGELRAVGGLCLRDGGVPVRTQARERVRTLEELPRPAWDLAPPRPYLDSGAMTGVNFGRSMPILASRGCPYRCTFCSSPGMWGTLWRVRPAREVFDEIREYMVTYNATNFDFYDLTAIVKKDWIKEFCTLVIDSGINITWQLPSGTRSEALDSEITALLYKSGCRYVNYAPESGSLRTLEAIRKKINKNTMLESMRNGVRNGLNIKSNLILGFPDESWRDFLDTMVFAARMAVAGVADLSTFPFSPYPGSELFTRLRAEGVVTLNDRYFYSLSQYTDPQYVKSYCAKTSHANLRRMCLFTMALFYAVSFLLHPWRAFALAWNVWRMTPKTKLADALVRIRKKRLQMQHSG